MIKANELEEWSNDVLPILTDINISINNIKTVLIQNAIGLPEIKHNFFRYYSYQQRFILIIQLAKFFSNFENQDRNFKKLCSRFENEELDENIEILLKENSSKQSDTFKTRDEILIAVADLKINLQKHKPVIDNVISLRDEVYAHTDTVKNANKIAIHELEELVIFANEIYNTLFGRLFDKQDLLDKTSDWDLRYIVKIIEHSETR